MDNKKPPSLDKIILTTLLLPQPVQFLLLQKQKAKKALTHFPAISSSAPPSNSQRTTSLENKMTYN